MGEHYWVKFPEKVTSHFFYSKLLPEVMGFYQNKDFIFKDMLFNWGDVEFINALVIPNILMLGHQMRILTGKKIVIYIPTVFELLQYLDDINFLNYARRFQIYDLYEDYIGGYIATPSVNRKSYYISNKYTMAEIWRVLGQSDKVIKATYHNNYETVKGIVAEKIKKELWEICKNSLEHANSFSFVTIQKECSINKIMISTADTGVGIYDTLKKKILYEKEKVKSNIDYIEKQQLHFMKNDTFLNLDNNDDKELYAIFEAVFYRWEDQIEDNNIDVWCSNGLWYLIDETLKKDEGTVRIHSNNYRLVFTKRLFSKVIQLNRLKSIYTTCEEQKLGKNQKYDNKLFFSIITNLKNTTNAKQYNYAYPGVHIEVEAKL